MSDKTRVRDIMTRKLVSVDADESVKNVAKRMLESDSVLLPVISEGRVTGTVTPLDIVARGVSEGLDPEQTPIRQVASVGLVFCREDDTIEAAALAMEEYRIRRLVVINDNLEATGLISLSDIAGLEAYHHLACTVLSHLEEPSHRGETTIGHSHGDVG